MPLVAPAPPAYLWLGLPACQVDSVTPANLLREGGHLPPTEWPSCSVTPVNLLRNTQLLGKMVNDVVNRTLVSTSFSHTHSLPLKTGVNQEYTEPNIGLSIIVVDSMV